MTSHHAVSGHGVGASVQRFEDRRFITGRGEFVADIDLPGQAHACLVRSPHAHAAIRRIETAPATATPGVLGVWTGADYAAQGFGNTACRMPRTRPDGSPDFQRPHPGLAIDRVRFVGDPVALVVGETREAARAGVERVAVEYEQFPCVTGIADAVRDGAPLVWPDFPRNISNVYEEGDKTAVERAIADAAHVVSRRFVINRIIAAPLEPRGVVAAYDPREERYTLYTDTQEPHAIRMAHAAILGIPQTSLRVVARDIGGGFGMKSSPYPEIRLCLWASRQLGRPVKWVADRTEAFQADDHARDNVSDVTLALDADGRFLALKVETLAGIGAYLSSDLGLIPTVANLGSLAGVYTTPAIHVTVSCVFANTNATGPYRGAGRPEATFLLESIIDVAARETGIDRVSLRRRNLIAPAALPYKTGLSFTYDSGEFEKNMDRALALADASGFARRRREAERRGRLRGLGIVNAIERAAAGPRPEQVEIRFDGGGGVTVLAGTKNHGQGHETIYRQMIAERLGIALSKVRVVDGDTDLVVHGHGTNSSRSAALGGGALYGAADRIIAKGRRIAAHLLEAGEGDIVFEQGRFTVAGTDRSLAIEEVARAAYQPGRLGNAVEPGLYASFMFMPEAATYPNGCHVCEVEIDPETGETRLVGYWAVDDCGTILNPALLAGQIHGGIAQGAGQALMEDIVHDPASGQLLTASFLDYPMPRAADFCDFVLEDNPVPTRMNPLGVKGAGEAGTVGALAVVMSAIDDALRPLGADRITMPATPQKVWRAIRTAKAKAATLESPG